MNESTNRTHTSPEAFKIVSVAEMRRIEEESNAAGLSYAEMMENAGSAVADAIAEEFPFAADAGVLVLAGPGNNGGDGLVCARLLHELGYPMRVFLWNRRTDSEHDYEDHFARLMALDVESARYDDEDGPERLDDWLHDCNVVVDALLGTGANRPIEGDLAGLLDQVAAIRVERHELEADFTVVAVDTPSGLNCDTGEVDPHTVPADITVTFAYAKTGHFRFPGAGMIGQLIIAEIGTDPTLVEEIHTFALAPEFVASLLPARGSDSHKGTFGKAMAIVGSVNFTGAVYLSCAAMGRAGAGLITGAVPQPVWGPVSSTLPEATWLLLSHDMGVVNENAVNLVNEKIAEYNALLVGPGLGQEETTKDFLKRLLAREKRVARSVLPGKFQASNQAAAENIDTAEQASKEASEAGTESEEEKVATPFGPLRRHTKSEPSAPGDIADLPALVIDADGLNNLAKIENWPDLLPRNTVLTPHPAEMARLCGLDGVDDVTANPWQLARTKAAEWNAIVLLKGPYTVIAHPDGRLAVLPVATPALATGGTGDVLAGAITGFLAQGLDPFDAASLGGWVHGRAGELCEEFIGPAGVLAGDVLPYLPDAMNELREW